MHDARQCTKIIKTNYYVLYSRELSIYSIQIPNYSDPFRSFEKKNTISILHILWILVWQSPCALDLHFP